QSPSSQYAAVIPKFVHAALRGESLPVHGDGRQSRDFTHVTNVVLANCLAAEAEDAAGEAMNIGCGESHAVGDIVETLRRILEPQGLRVAWQHEAARRGDVRSSLADIGKARRLLGYCPVVPFGEGLRETLDAAAG